MFRVDFLLFFLFLIRVCLFQIGCSLVGSLSALYNGVLLINLVVALFALIAIESSSQSLGRTYAVLLLCAILLDIAWFIFISHTMRYEFVDFSVLFNIRLFRFGLVIHLLRKNGKNCFFFFSSCSKPHICFFFYPFSCFILVVFFYSDL